MVVGWRGLKIPVCSLSVFHFKDVDDQNIVMDGKERPDTPPDPDRIYRVPGIRRLYFFDMAVGIFADCMDFPDDLPGEFLWKFTEVAICPRSIFDLVWTHLTPYFFIISFSRIRLPLRTSSRDSSSPVSVSSLKGSSSTASVSRRSITSLYDSFGWRFRVLSWVLRSSRM